MLLCYIFRFDLFQLTRIAMSDLKQPAQPAPDALYCPNCAREVTDPLTCGDCSAVICRACGTPLESSADLGMG
jgi:hypothetical protein